MRRIAVCLVLVAGLVHTATPVHGAPVKLTDVRVEMDDGVRLAADVYLPEGTPTDGSAEVPCLVELTPYRKESRAAEGVAFLPPNGFGLIEVDARGTGGSEGQYDIVFSLREQYDTAAMIDWAAAQPYCSDKVGMFGGSYSGIIQYLVATLPPDRAPQHLAAIAPQRAYGDLYRDIVYHGGQLIGSFGLVWSAGTTAFYLQPPTDMPGDDAMSAWGDHLTLNDPMMAFYIANPYADAQSHGQRLYTDSSALPRIGNMRVPVLHLAGWFDSFTRGQLLTFQHALAQESGGGRGPNYLIVGPWNHANTHFVTPPNFTDRLLDWYSHWLADGPVPSWFGDDRVHYYVMGTGGLNDTTGEWRDAASWPPPEADVQRLYLRGGGALNGGVPTALDAGSSAYVTNPTAGVSEFPSRWDNAAFGLAYTENDQRIDEPKGVAFTTTAFEEPVTIAGPMSLKLWAATTGLPGRPDLASAWPGAGQLAPPYHDTDWVVKVSDVAPDGSSRLVTEGFLRASHRVVDLGASQVLDGEVVGPYHPHTQASLEPPAAGEARDYLAEVWPTAKTFAAGHRLRVTVYSNDTPNHLTLATPALNEVLHEPLRASYLAVPLVPSPES